MKRLLIFTVISLTALFAACGGVATTEAPQATAPPFDFVVTQAPAATAPPFEAPATAAPVSEGGTPSPSQLSFAPSGSKLVIKDAEMELLVANTDTAIARVTQMAADAGGYILDSQTWYQDGFKFAMLKLGLPSAEFEKSLNFLRSLAIQIVRENASGQDVSAAYVDLQSQLTNLEATSARVRDFLKDAKTVEDSLRINGQLSELEGQIEQVKGQMRFYEGRAAFSTVTVYLTPQYPTPTSTLTPTPTATPTATPTLTPTQAWNPGQTFGQATGVLENMTQTTLDILIWLVVVGGPMLLVGGLIIAAARWLVRRRG